MADPVKTPSETSNQPVVETPAPVAAPAVPAKPADPPSPTTPTVEPSTSPDPVPVVTDDQAKALIDAAAARAAAETAAKVIPESYDIKLPETMVAAGIKLDPELLPTMAPALKDAGLTQAQFQKVAEAFLTFQARGPERVMARDFEVTSKDPDIGGMKYAQTLKHVGLALDAFADPGFKQFVKSAGIGNRLEFVRVFQRIGEAMAKAGDVPSRSSPDAAPEITRAQRLYGASSKPA